MREVVRRAVWKTKNQLLARSARVARSPYLARRLAVGRAERRVETAQARVAGGGRDLADGQARFGQEFFREQEAPRRSDFDRACAELFGEQTAQMTLADADAPRELGQRSLVERTLLDQSQCAGDEIALRAMQRRSGCRFRTAAQARPEAGGGSRGGAVVIANVARLRRWRRTNRTAIDACRRDGDEEEPVEARVARFARAIADAAIEGLVRGEFSHGASLARRCDPTSRFRPSIFVTLTRFAGEGWVRQWRRTLSIESAALRTPLTRAPRDLSRKRER